MSLAATSPEQATGEHSGRAGRLDDWSWETPFRDTIQVHSTAHPATVMEAFREVTPREMPLATWLGRLRYWPSRFAGGEAARRAQLDPDQSFVASLTSGRGTCLLESGKEELVFGTIGKLHQIRDQEPVPLETPGDFRSFHEPGHEKLVMSFRVIPDGAGGTLMSFEHRTSPTDEESHQRFARYWWVIRPAGAFVTRQLLRATARRAERHQA